MSVDQIPVSKTDFDQARQERSYMRPSIGRIVHYVAGLDFDTKATKILPGIVIAVRGMTVDLNVFSTNGAVVRLEVRYDHDAHNLNTWRWPNREI
jgi:hypothetical protein